MRSNNYINQKLFLIFFGFFFLHISQQVFADSVTEKTTASSEQKVINHQTNEALEIAFAGIERQRKTIKDYEERIANSEGTKKQILEAWLDKSWLKLLEQGVDYAEAVEAKKNDDINKEDYQQKAKKILGEQSEIANTVINRIHQRIKLPEQGISAVEKTAAFSKIFVLLESIQRTVDLQIKSLEIAKDFELDVTAQDQSLRKSLSNRAISISILLDSMMEDVVALSASAKVVPDDTELATKLNVAKRLAQRLAVSLNSVLDMMADLDMDTSAYRELVLSNTGVITIDVLDVGVGSRLLTAWGKNLWNGAIENGPDVVFKIFLFILILYISKKLSKIAHSVVEKSFNKSNIHFSELLRRMIFSLTRNVIILLGFLVALSQIGIRIGPLFAGLGIIGFIIGFALQDSLSNFASGLMILLYRPYDVGSLIEAAGVFGKVSHMSLVNTTVITFDNQTIVIPNNKIWGDVVKNVTAQATRRVDMVFGISYTDDIPKAEKILKEILDSNHKVLKDPEPIVRLHELADSSVNFVVRPWVATDDYWDVYWAVTRAVKMKFDSEEISIPFPQRDVHVYNHALA